MVSSRIPGWLRFYTGRTIIHNSITQHYLVHFLTPLTLVSFIYPWYLEQNILIH